MELLHYSVQFHSHTTTQQHDLEPVVAILFHSRFFLRLVHPRPELVPSTAVLRLPGHLLRRSGPASIGALLSRLGVSDDLVRFLGPEIFRTVVAVSCGASNVGLVAVEIWAATPYDDVEEIDRALRELGEEYTAAVGAAPAAASDLGVEGLGLERVGVGVDRCCSYGGEECAICLGDLGSGAIRLPCKHVYHEDCIVKWLKNKNVCPLCRSSIRLNMS